jgi:hypothetical protein
MAAASNESLHRLALRVGIVASGLTLPAWQARCLRKLTAAGARVALRIDPSPPGAEVPDAPVEGASFRLYWRWVTRRCPALRREPLDGEIEPAEEIALPDFLARGAGSPDGVGSDLDLILDFSERGITTPALAGMARHGVWRVWHGEDDADGSSIAHLDSPPDGSTLRLAIVAARPGHRAILYEARLRRRWRALGNLNRGLSAAADSLLSACARLPPAWFAVPGREVREGEPAARHWTAWALAGLLLRRAAAFLPAPEAVFRLHAWNIGSVAMPVADVIRTGRLGPVRWMKRPSAARFYADPMVLPSRPGAFLAEEYSYWTGRGTICLIDDLDGEPRPAEGLDTGLHMSFPYQLDTDQGIVCLPESAETGGVQLFRAVSFPDHWEQIAPLLPDFAGIDATVFEHARRWWLICGRGGELADAQLFVWYADSPLGPWSPHRLNPVKTDARSSRSAGPPLVVDGVLYRPAQDCSYTYGGALVINRVLVLSPDQFVEEVAFRLEPDPAGRYPHGLHTICANGDTTLIDGKRITHHPAAPLMKIWAKLVHDRRRSRAGS